MTRIIISIIITFSGFLSVYSQNLLIKNVSIIDVINGATIHNQDVLILNGKIENISSYLPDNQQAIAIKGNGKWLMPGMIDAHIHLFQSGGLYTRPDIINLQQFRDYQKEIKWVWDNTEDFLRRYLRCGITSVIDMGGPFENFNARKKVEGNPDFPNLFITGPLISTYQPDAFKIDDAPIIKVHSKEEAVSLIKKQMPHNPDFIKIWYIARYEETAEQNFNLMKATIDESHKHGFKVAVHATELETAKYALKAGADILVHSIDDEIDDELIKLTKSRKAIYIPTMIVHKQYINTFIKQAEITDEDLAFANPFTLGSITDLKHLENTEKLITRKAFTPEGKQLWFAQDKTRKENLMRLLNEGVVIAVGTDAGNIGTQHASSYYQELKAMHEAGMSNADLLRSATINSAMVLNKETILGSVSIGKTADLLLLNSNPLEDINAVKDIQLVIKSGKPHIPDELIKPTAEELAQMQVNAYNARNLDAFLYPYADDVKIFDFGGKLIMQGKEQMLSRYKTLFEDSPNLHCRIVNRMVLGNTVIDRETVTGFRGNNTINAIAIYLIDKNKIKEVHFIRE